MILKVGLPIGLAFIMFSMGLDLVLEDFKRVSKMKRAFVTGFFLQVIALPAIAFSLVYLWTQFQNPDPVIVIGLIIIAACPGGVLSNMLTHLSNGDTALSISLTAVISLMSLITLPLIVNLGLSFFTGSESVSLPIAKTIVGIFCVTTVPVMIGMIIRHKRKDLALKYEPAAKNIATLIFGIICIAAIAKNWDLLIENYQTVFHMVLSLNISTMALAFFAAKALGLNEGQRNAIVFECGLQNGTLAITIALTFLGNEKYMFAGVVYSILMLVTGGAYLAFVARKKAA